MKNFKEIQKIKRKHSFSLLCKTGVLGVGIGYKEINGKTTKEKSIKILVE